MFAIVRNNNVLEGYAMLIFQDEDTRSLEIALECLYSLLTLDNKLKTSKDEPSLLLFDLRSIPNMIDRLENLQYSQS